MWLDHARALGHAAEAIRGGEDIAAATATATAAILDAGFATVDYVAVRAAANLQPVVTYDGNQRILAAAWLGDVRLIDNMAV